MARAVLLPQRVFELVGHALISKETVVRHQNGVDGSPDIMCYLSDVQIYLAAHLLKSILSRLIWILQINNLLISLFLNCDIDNYRNSFIIKHLLIVFKDVEISRQLNLSNTSNQILQIQLFVSKPHIVIILISLFNDIFLVIKSVMRTFYEIHDQRRDFYFFSWILKKEFNQ